MMPGQTNQLGVPGGPVAQPMPTAGGVSPLMSAVMADHDHASAQFAQTSKWMEHQRTLFTALSGLAKLGDTVSPEDVIKSAGDLVGTGTHSPVEMATLLAEMPPGGQPLQQWIQTNLAKNMATTQKLEAMHSVARHEMGVSGLRMLQSSALEGQQAQAPTMPIAGAGGPANALNPGA